MIIIMKTEPTAARSRRRSAATRSRILAAAAAAIRRRGPARVGVLEVMREAGLTHGGFYAHFASRDDLVAAAIRGIFAEGPDRFARRTAGLEGIAALRAWIDSYVSPAHRDNAAGGCALPALVSDMPHLEPAARQAFDDGLRGIAARLAAHLPDRKDFDADGFTLALVCTMAGAVALSRAVTDPGFSGRILDSARAELQARLDRFES